MLRFIPNNKGIMGLTLSHIGLFIATGILLSAVFSFIYLNDYYRKEDLDNIGQSFSTMVEAMDTNFFENKTKFFFPEKDFTYHISISTEYIIVESDGNWNNIVSSKNNFLIKPCLRKNNSNWTSGKELHIFIKDKYGYSGNQTDTIQSDKVKSVKNYLNTIRKKTNLTFALNPLIIDVDKPVFIEKTYVFYDLDDDNLWNKNIDEKQSLILIYQK